MRECSCPLRATGAVLPRPGYESEHDLADEMTKQLAQGGPPPIVFPSTSSRHPSRARHTCPPLPDRTEVGVDVGSPNSPIESPLVNRESGSPAQGRLGAAVPCPFDAGFHGAGAVGAEVCTALVRLAGPVRGERDSEGRDRFLGCLPVGRH